MDADRDRAPRTPRPKAVTIERRKPSSLSSWVLGAIILLMIGAFALVMIHVLHLMPDDGREADGWMYTQVSLVPAACPALTKEVETIASRPKMTVGEAKFIAKRLWETSVDSSRAWRQYEGRQRLGLKTGPRPSSCAPFDPREPGREVPILDEGSFAAADLENSRS